MVTDLDVKIAAQNWRNWKVVFEHGGTPDKNPLLLDASLFKRFLREYSVQRTIRAGCSDKLRQLLCSQDFPLNALLSDETGRILDRKETALKQQYGSKGQSLISAISKVAAFLAPHTFVAWDKYARRGVNLSLRRARSNIFRSYAEYLEDINRLMRSEIGEQVSVICAGKYPTAYSSELGRFHRRVLDVYLMRIGGRNFEFSRAAKEVSTRYSRTS